MRGGMPGRMWTSRRGSSLSETVTGIFESIVSPPAELSGQATEAFRRMPTHLRGVDGDYKLGMVPPMKGLKSRRNHQLWCGRQLGPLASTLSRSLIGLPSRLGFSTFPQIRPSCSPEHSYPSSPRSSIQEKNLTGWLRAFLLFQGIRRMIVGGCLGMRGRS